MTERERLKLEIRRYVSPHGVWPIVSDLIDALEEEAYVDGVESAGRDEPTTGVAPAPIDEVV